METKDNAPARKPVTKKEIAEAIKKGHYAKATKLVKASDQEADVKEAAIAEIKVRWDKQKEEAKKKKAAKPAAKPAEKQPATVESISAKYADLISELASFEVDRRAQKKHVNFFIRHRRQVEGMKRNFEKFGTR